MNENKWIDNRSVLAATIRESSDTHLVLRIVKASLFIHQPDRVEPKSSDIKQLIDYINTREKIRYFFTCVVTAFLRAGNPLICKIYKILGIPFLYRKDHPVLQIFPPVLTCCPSSKSEWVVLFAKKLASLQAASLLHIWTQVNIESAFSFWRAFSSSRKTFSYM